jgi:hypothetical protein
MAKTNEDKPEMVKTLIRALAIKGKLHKFKVLGLPTGKNVKWFKILATFL